MTRATAGRLGTMDRARRGYELRRSGIAWREIAEALDLTINARGQQNLGHVCSMVRRYAERSDLTWPVTQPAPNVDPAIETVKVFQ